MTACPKCSREGPANATHCSYCGSAMGPSNSMPDQGTPKSDIGSSLGSEMDKLGNEIGKRIETAGKDFSLWWDNTFWIFSPVIIGTIGVIMLLFGLMLVDFIASNSDEPSFWWDLGDFGRDYIWLFGLLMFAGAFSDYLLRKYRKVYIWIRPPVTATLVVVWVWAFAQVAKMIELHFDEEAMGTIGRFLEDFWVLVFLFALVVGYIVSWAWLMGSVVRRQEGDMKRIDKP